MATNGSPFGHFQLTSVKLDGTNYPSWSKAVEVYITATRQLAYLTSTISSNMSKAADWIAGDAMIRTLLWNSMDPKVSPHFIQCDSAKAIWDKCALLYSGQNNMMRVCDTSEKLFDIQCGDQSLSDYYALFTTLYQRLDTYLPASNDPDVLAKRQEDLRVILYLKSLGPEYSSLRQHITSQSFLPTIDEVFSQALCSTIPEKSSSMSAVEINAMLSCDSSGRGARGCGYRGHGRGVVHGGSCGGREGGVGTHGTINSGNSRGSRYCHHCQRAGHTKTYCYTLHLELKPPIAAYAEVEDSLGPPSIAPPSSTQVLKIGDSVTLTRAKYDTLVRSQQVTGSSAPTAILAQTSKGSSVVHHVCFLHRLILGL
ncbi:hypothetical protein ACJRO7_016919 [Eucalyptus globulus]|uniref:Retrotransposon Copia-like N-terminal domain-containing protein n=1 Tax=Eucalyptus globulus TaxID=34317 RepID=A0ABD3KVK2_EUCGL